MTTVLMSFVFDCAWIDRITVEMTNQSKTFDLYRETETHTWDFRPQQDDGQFDAIMNGLDRIQNVLVF